MALIARLHALSRALVASYALRRRAKVVTTDGSKCGDGYETAIRFNVAIPHPFLRAAVSAARAESARGLS
ncbi:hypothetical protein [Microbacterium sp. JB110]|uniref:hypothetical protein n=1 Tax=Microbacterium sp. JB110 TaxID=2024477 RepID=UPI00097F466D|nr:hypothetical protein [Microbacterium sp. JB110]RCS60826.1 hypothetical protein CIK77_09155 [Microbacterium sp. JB110]SJM64515.1 hypothetical protein CZ774_12940 [Frigoribacterium sp. JB110]